MSVELLKDIKEELRELRRLYQSLVDKFIPMGEPTEDERTAIEEHDELLDEKTLMNSLER